MYWVLNIAYMQRRHFQQMWRRDVHVKTRKVLLLLFCLWRLYITHSDCLVVILKFYIIAMFLHAVRNFKPESIFKQTRVNIFYRESMTSFVNYDTATLRALFVWRGSFLKKYWGYITQSCEHNLQHYVFRADKIHWQETRELMR